MDATGIIAIIAAVTLGAVQIITAMQNGRKVDALGARAEGVAETLATKTREVAAGLATQAKAVADDTADKLSVIHELTNSNMTRVKEDLAAANAKIERLEKLVEDLAHRNREEIPEA